MKNQNQIYRTSSLDFTAYLLVKGYNLIGIEKVPGMADWAEFLISIPQSHEQKLRKSYSNGDEVSANRLFEVRKKLIEKLQNEIKEI